MDGHPQGLSCPACPQWCWAWSQRSLFSHSCSELALSVLVPPIPSPCSPDVDCVDCDRLEAAVADCTKLMSAVQLLQLSALSGNIGLLHSAPWRYVITMMWMWYADVLVAWSKGREWLWRGKSKCSLRAQVNGTFT